MSNYILTSESTHADYLSLENKLSTEFIDYATGAAVTAKNGKEGYVSKFSVFSGPLFNQLLAIVQFDDGPVKYSVKAAFKDAGFLTFKDPELAELYEELFEIHTRITKQDKANAVLLEQKAKEEAAKKAAAEKAEKAFQKRKEKAFAEFETLTSRKKPAFTVSDKFYYALGWLTKHMGTITATCPDYLEKTIKAYYGDDIALRVVDASKKTTGGFSMKWAFSIQANLKKAEAIPACLESYINPARKALTNSSFILDLIEVYGFKWGKNQNADEIRRNIPTKYLSIFEEGLAA